MGQWKPLGCWPGHGALEDEQILGLCLVGSADHVARRLTSPHGMKLLTGPRTLPFNEIKGSATVSGSTGLGQSSRAQLSAQEASPAALPPSTRRGDAALASK